MFLFLNFNERLLTGKYLTLLFGRNHHAILWFYFRQWKSFDRNNIFRQSFYYLTWFRQAHGHLRRYMIVVNINRRVTLSAIDVIQLENPFRKDDQIRSLPFRKL